MSDVIYLKTGQFSNRSFNASKKELKKAADALNILDDHGAMSNTTYTCDGISRPIFSEATIVDAAAAATLVNHLYDKLETYSSLLQSGPDALHDADSSFKGEYTNAWQRSWYSVSSGVSSVYNNTVSFWGSLFRKSGKKTDAKTKVQDDSNSENKTDNEVVEEKDGEHIPSIQEPENRRTNINDETIDNYSDESGRKNDVQRGRIRWVYQYIPEDADDAYYDKNGWLTDTGALNSNPNQQCNSASASMALSYMGIDRSPASLVGPGNDMDPASWGTCNNTWTTENGEIIQLENHALDCNMNDINAKTELFLNDGGKGEVSPVMIRYAYPGEDAGSPGAYGHWLIIVGNNGDGTYQVIGPGRMSERLTTVSIDEYGNICGDGIGKGGGRIQRYAQYSRIH